MQAFLNSLTVAEITSLIISAISLLGFFVSISVALSNRKEAKAATAQAQLAKEQFELASKQYRQTLFSNVIVYLLSDRYILADRQLNLGITNIGQVAVTNVRIAIHKDDFNKLFDSFVASVLFPQETEKVNIGESIHNFLERNDIIKYTDKYYKIQKSENQRAKSVTLFVEIQWTPSTADSMDSQMLKRLLTVFIMNNKKSITREPATFGLRLGNKNDEA